MTWYKKGKAVDDSDIDPQFAQAYNALMAASERIGRAEYKAGKYKAVHERNGRLRHGYSLSSAHQEVQQALDDLCRNKITPEEAMAVLHGYDVSRTRLSVPPARR